MRITLTITELLGKIKSEKKRFDELYKSYLEDPEASSRLMITLRRSNTDKTVNGESLEDVRKQIISTNMKILTCVSNLEKLLIIKEQVNAVSTVKVPNFKKNDGSLTELTVAEVLMMKSQAIKNYRYKYIERLEHDLQLAKSSLSEYNKSVLSIDKVNAYVNARMNSLKMSTDSNIDAYKTFSNEYIEANTLEIDDPLDISNVTTEVKDILDNFYEQIDNILSVFNAKTKIWIDLEADSKDSLWGFIDN